MQFPSLKAIGNETILQIIAVVAAAVIIASVPTLRRLVHEGRLPD